MRLMQRFQYSKCVVFHGSKNDLTPEKKVPLVAILLDLSKFLTASVTFYLKAHPTFINIKVLFVS